MRVMRLVLAATVFAVVGCGGGSTSANGGSSASPVVDARNSDQIASDTAAAQAALLTLADFPSGWEAKQRSPSTADTPEAKAATKKFGDCLGADPSLFDDVSSGAKAKSDRFTDSKNLRVESNVTLEGSESIVSQGFAALTKPEARGCFGDFIKTATAYGLEHPSNGSSPPEGLALGDPTVGTVNLAGLPNEAVVYRVMLPFTIKGLSIKLYIDFVFAAQGRAEMTLTFQNVGDPFPNDLEATLTATAVGRLPAG